MTVFDMPKTGTWEQRGGWVVTRLCADLGLKDFQAAGDVGNLGYESVQFKTLQEISPLVAGSKGGYGWGQWTGMPGRRSNFMNWCSQHALAPASDEANYGFHVFELRGAYKGVLAQLRMTTSIEDATHLMHKSYETPSDVLDGSYRSGPDRLALARRALNGARVTSTAPAQSSPLITAHGPIALGDRSADAAELQRRLLAKGYDVGAAGADGVYGDDTDNALWQWATERDDFWTWVWTELAK